MIKLIVFDLDGVLVSTKDIHYVALNKALNDSRYTISLDEHYDRYDGLPTAMKLKMLTVEKKLPVSEYDRINEEKQKYTFDLIRQMITRNDYLIQTLKKLKQDGLKIYVASNAIRETVKLLLYYSGLIEYVDYYISNEDVKYPKPSPEMYLRCMIDAGVSPDETLIVEDSPKGIKAAQSSKSHLMIVENPESLTYEKIINQLNSNQNKSNIKIKLPSFNILIPMAGEGSRFQKAGYTFPKPMIDILGKPMIQVVTDNLGFDSNYIYVVRKEHYDTYNLKNFLNLITPNCKIVIVDKLTEGAACTTLLASEYINNDDPLIIANSDQYVEWNPIDFYYKMIETKADAGIVTFKSCFGYQTLIDTKEYGKIPIGKIVNQKIDCSVLTYNTNKKQFEYIKINDYIKLSGKLNEWVKIKSKWGGVTYVTSDHNFLTKNGWKEIGKIGKNKILTTFNKMSTIQREVFNGTMLGDASIAKGYKYINSGLKFSHSIKQKDWALTKLNVFKNLNISNYEAKIGKYDTIQCRVKINEEFKDERLKWYPENKKIVNKDIELTPICLATWYMDDGCLTTNKNPNPRFATDGYEIEDINFLQKKLLEIKLRSYLILNKKTNRYRLVIDTESSNRFFDMVADYIIPSMSYKLPLNYRNKCSYEMWMQDFSSSDYYHYEPNVYKFKEKTWFNRFSYCLETDNENFIVDNMVAHNCHPKWSFAKLNEHENVIEVAEKNPISDLATAGIYYYKKGSDYVKYAKQMIEKNIRVRGEFYVAPVFNEFILDGKKIKTYNISKMWGLGTPEDLEHYVKNHS